MVEKEVEYVRHELYMADTEENKERKRRKIRE